ncbi:hypothetical protein I6N90_01555 [Paenibacillus sp. GSMTC-2017]|uniref:hypothetical protein n=1 Tax=Paenibacillus sp. GSMTC-2017 TaxID=2794350 RepID=UPI001A2622C2|nr:hypothetical protein [Paenibacillus sp. GSMTC-2017]MBH5316490.1 hypothetical protein [Paenibacillus sp. GSMTC-2017]
MFSETVYGNSSMNEFAHIFTDSFQRYDGIVGYAVSKEDQKWQNTTDIDAFMQANKTLDRVTFKPDDFGKDKEIIDIETLPGYNHFTREGIWFGSAWKMWFGHKFFSYIPKEKLLTFTDGYSNLELSNGAISITLYDNIWAYNRPLNREIQWKFRKQVGIDEVAHKTRYNYIKRG